jgi:hypothetical protein
MVERGPAGRCQTLPSSPPSKWQEAQLLLKSPVVWARDASSKISSPRRALKLTSSLPVKVLI